MTQKQENQNGAHINRKNQFTKVSQKLVAVFLSYCVKGEQQIDGQMNGRKDTSIP